MKLGEKWKKSSNPKEIQLNGNKIPVGGNGPISRVSLVKLVPHFYCEIPRFELVQLLNHFHQFHRQGIRRVSKRKIQPISFFDNGFAVRKNIK